MVPIAPLAYAFFRLLSYLLYRFGGGLKVSGSQGVRIAVMTGALLVGEFAWREADYGKLALCVAVGVPPLWWPALMLLFGAHRTSAVIAGCIWPLVWIERSRRQRSFFLTLGATHDLRGWFARRAEAGLSRWERTESGAELASHAVLSLHRGELEVARALFGLVASMSPHLAPRCVRAYSHHFCLSDAALRGNWREVTERSRWGPWTPTATVFAYAARLRLGQAFWWHHASGWCSALLAAHRIWAFRLIGWARAPRPEHRLDSAMAAGSLPLHRRLQELARLETEAPGALSPESIEELATLVEGLPDDADSLARVQQRLAELDARADASELLEQLQASARDALVSHLERAWICEERVGSFTSIAHAAAQARLMDDIERLRDALCDRTNRAADTGGLTHWLVWAKLRAKLDQVWCLAPSSRETVFDSVWCQLTDTASELWNEGQERALGHDILYFLYQRRKHTQLAEARQLIRENRKVSRML